MPPHLGPATNYLFMVLSKEKERREGRNRAEKEEGAKGERSGNGEGEGLCEDCLAVSAP